MNIQSLDSESIKKVFDTPFSSQFIFSIEQLNYRLDRLSKINPTDASNNKEYLMVFDAAMVLFRAMFLEKGDKNYTFQNYYRLIGQPKVAEAIDAFLDSRFESWSELTIRTLLKKIADKFVCHIDSITAEELGLINAYMAKLSSPVCDNNFQNIVRNINAIIEKERETLNL
jgi:hypothetical protein